MFCALRWLEAPEGWLSIDGKENSVLVQEKCGSSCNEELNDPVNEQDLKHKRSPYSNKASNSNIDIAHFRSKVDLRTEVFRYSHVT